MVVFPLSWSSTARLDRLQFLAGTGKLLHDFTHGGRPYERAWIVVPRRKEFRDLVLQIWNTDKDTAADGFVGQFAEPALHQVQPTRTGGDKVTNETWVLR